MACLPKMLSFILLVLCVGVSRLSLAAPQFFTDEDAFASAFSILQNSHFTDFESVAPFGERVGGGVSSFSHAGIDFQAMNPSIKIMDRRYSGNKNTTDGGRQYLSIDTDLRRQGDQVGLTFGRSLAAFGFNLIDHDADDAILSWNGGSFQFDEVADGGVQFLGIIFDPMELPVDSFLLDTGRDAQVAMDDMYYAYSELVHVSEPNMMICLLILAGGVWFRSGRARSA